MWCSEAIAIPQNTTPTKVEPLSTKLDVSEAAKSTKPKNFAFVIAKHVILHQQQIISMDLIETILDEASKDSKIHPSFLLTNGGHTKEAALSDARWKWYGLSSRRFV